MTQWDGQFVRDYGSLPGGGTGCGFSPLIGDEIGPVKLSQIYTNIIQLPNCTWQLTVACESSEGDSFIIWRGVKAGWPMSSPRGVYKYKEGCDTRPTVTVIDCPPSSESEVPSDFSSESLILFSSESSFESFSELPSISSEIPPVSSSAIPPLSSEFPSISSEIPPVSSSAIPLPSESEQPSWSLWSPPSDISSSIPIDSSFGIDSSDLATECCKDLSCCLTMEGDMWSACYGPGVKFPLALSGSACGGPNYWSGALNLPAALVAGCKCGQEVQFEIVCETGPAGPPTKTFYIYLHYCGKTVKQRGNYHCECTDLVDYKFDISFNIKLWPDVGCDCVEYPSNMQLRFYCIECSESSSSSSASASGSSSASASGSASASASASESASEQPPPPDSSEEPPIQSSEEQPPGPSSDDIQFSLDSISQDSFDSLEASTDSGTPLRADWRIPYGTGLDRNDTLNPWFM